MNVFDLILAHYLISIWPPGIKQPAELLWLIVLIAQIIKTNRNELKIQRPGKYNQSNIKILSIGAVLIVINFIAAQKNEYNSTLTYQSTGILKLAVIFIASAIAEELLFREVLQQKITSIIKQINIKNKQFAIIVITSSIFAFAHCLNIHAGYNSFYVSLQVLTAWILGMFLSYMRIKFNGIKECCQLHILFNLATL